MCGAGLLGDIEMRLRQSPPHFVNVVCMQLLSVALHEALMAPASTGAASTDDADDGVSGNDQDHQQGGKQSPQQHQAALLALQQGQAVKLLDVRPEQHFTRPPPQYTEASLIKALEQLGIGRPSTYAATLKVLQASPARAL